MAAILNLEYSVMSNKVFLCFIVFLDTENILFVEKMMSLSKILKNI